MSGHALRYIEEQDGPPGSRVGVASHSFQGYAFVGRHTGDVCGQPVACPGRELSGLAAHLPGGEEACLQHSLHSAPTRQTSGLCRKRPLSVLPIPEDLAGALARPLC